MSTPPPGWYPDQSMPNTPRFWDGTHWSPTAVAPLAPAAGAQSDNRSIVTFGIIMAFFLPIVGFIIGLTQINRGKDGLLLIMLSIGSCVGWWYLLSQ
jgi:hypothetical protein